MEVKQSLLRLALVLTLCVTLGQGHIVYDSESSQTMAQMLDLEKFFQLQDEINAITEDIEPLKDLSLEVKQGIKKLFFILNNLIKFLETHFHFQYNCPEGTCKVGKKCLYVMNTDEITWENARDFCGDRGGKLYQPPLPPYFPDFTQDLANSCPDLLTGPVWIEASFVSSSNEFVYSNGCIIPENMIDETSNSGPGTDIRDTASKGFTKQYTIKGNLTHPTSNSLVNQSRSARQFRPITCANLVLAFPLDPSVPFACPSSAQEPALCEFDAVYNTFDAGEGIHTDPTEEELEGLQIHHVHETLRSGLEFVALLKDGLKI